MLKDLDKSDAQRRRWRRLINQLTSDRVGFFLLIEAKIEPLCVVEGPVIQAGDIYTV